MSSDGEIIVIRPIDGLDSGQKSWIVEDQKVTEFSEYLRLQGIDTTGWSNVHVDGISDDGMVLVGRAAGYGAFRVVVPEPNCLLFVLPLALRRKRARR